MLSLAWSRCKKWWSVGAAGVIRLASFLLSHRDRSDTLIRVMEFKPHSLILHRSNIWLIRVISWANHEVETNIQSLHEARQVRFIGAPSAVWMIQIKSHCLAFLEKVCSQHSALRFLLNNSTKSKSNQTAWYYWRRGERGLILSSNA